MCQDRWSCATTRVTLIPNASGHVHVVLHKLYSKPLDSRHLIPNHLFRRLKRLEDAVRGTGWIVRNWIVQVRYRNLLHVLFVWNLSHVEHQHPKVQKARLARAARERKEHKHKPTVCPTESGVNSDDGDSHDEAFLICFRNSGVVPVFQDVVRFRLCGSVPSVGGDILRLF